MERKIRIAAVNYMNALPLIYGFEQGQMADKVELIFEHPAKIAVMLLEGKIDAGLVPVAVMSQLPGHQVISDYCIATEGEVASVCVFSDVPLQQASYIYTDYQSRSSVALLKILLKHHWKLSMPLIASEPGYEEKIKGDVAGLVIGDRALSQRRRSAYIYDLGIAWKEMTGLPFVFAAWIANKKLSPGFIEAFNQATSEGLKHIEEIAAGRHFSDYDLRRYYSSNISYVLDDKKREAISLFREYLSAE